MTNAVGADKVKSNEMRTTGFTRVSVYARDLDESARFYERFFGMKEIPSPDFSCTLAEGQTSRSPQGTPNLG
jgi:catechol 2,3-dioxygenase-like lactoylglutathione lyase family enzyme